MAFVQLTFGGTINRQLRDIVTWMTAEDMLLYYLQTFREIFFKKPDATCPPTTIRTQEVLLRYLRSIILFFLLLCRIYFESKG